MKISTMISGLMLLVCGCLGGQVWGQHRCDCNASNPGPIPINYITSIGCDSSQKPTYVFYPKCGTERCTDAIIRKHILEWEVAGENEYSVAENLTRRFSNSSPKKIILRYSGIKEDEAARQILNPKITTIPIQICPQFWDYNLSSEITLVTNKVQVSHDRFSVTEFVRAMPSVTSGPKSEPVHGIGAPYCGKVIWNEQAEFPVAIYNRNSLYSYDIRLKITADILGQPVQLTPRKSGRATCNVVGDTLFVNARLAPLEYSTVLFRANIGCRQDDPRLQFRINQSHDCVTNSQSDVYCAPSGTFLSDRIISIDSSIDPNAKWIVNPKPFYLPGDTVMYALFVENVGSMQSEEVKIEDLLDERFDWNGIRYHSSYIFSKDFRAARSSAPNHFQVYYDQSRKQRICNIIFGETTQVGGTEAGRTGQDTLAAQEGMLVLLKFPLRTELDSARWTCLPEWLLRTDSTLVEVPNVARSIFGAEGQWYEVSSHPNAKVLKLAQAPNALFWWLLALLILLLLLLIVFIIWRLRRRRR